MEVRIGLNDAANRKAKESEKLHRAEFTTLKPKKSTRCPLEGFSVAHKKYPGSMAVVIVRE
jgi:hypothetical protein